MIGGVTSHMLPHLSAVFHLYENKPLVRNFTRFQSLMFEKVNTFLNTAGKMMSSQQPCLISSTQLLK